MGESDGGDVRRRPRGDPTVPGGRGANVVRSRPRSVESTTTTPGAAAGATTDVAGRRPRRRSPRERRSSLRPRRRRKWRPRLVDDDLADHDVDGRRGHRDDGGRSDPEDRSQRAPAAARHRPALRRRWRPARDRREAPDPLIPYRALAVLAARPAPWTRQSACRVRRSRDQRSGRALAVASWTEPGQRGAGQCSNVAARGARHRRAGHGRPAVPVGRGAGRARSAHGCAQRARRRRW